MAKRSEHDDSRARGPLRVGEVALLAHVSVRTLHHYDRVGLVRPSCRTEAGYRLYSEQELERLQTVLLYKELGFGLGEIATCSPIPGSAGVRPCARSARSSRAGLTASTRCSP